eukprot:g70732.t1
MLGALFIPVPEEVEEELDRFVATIWKEWEELEAQIREAEGAEEEEEVIDLTVVQEVGRRRGRPSQVECLARSVVGGGQRSVADFFSADNSSHSLHPLAHAQHAHLHIALPVESLERSRVTERPRATNGGTCPTGSKAN